MVISMLKLCREKSGLTQENLAEIIKIDIRTYQYIEAEKTIPMGNTLARIILALNLNDQEIKDLLIYYSKKNTKKGKKEII